MVGGTTTWRNRNYDRLIQAKDEAVRLGMKNPFIIDVGPGGAVEFLFGLLPEGNVAYLGLFRCLQRGFVKLFETALRRVGSFDLKTTEPEEISCAFQELSPREIYVVDKEQLVINAVRRIVERNGLQVPISYNKEDIEKASPAQRGDVVIAYNVLQRTGNPARSLENLACAVIPGGILSTTCETAPQGFITVRNGLYVKK
jgi:hypothetical protein